MSESVATREDIPLKNGKITKKWYDCYEDCFSGSKYIKIAFGALTIIITLALLIQIYYGDYQIIPHGSVASDSFECSKIGTSILKKGGNAVDAAIATAFCLSIATPHLTGLDAEGKILIYNHKNRNQPVVINFSHGIMVSKNLPTLVMGLAYLHKEFSSLSWKELVYPSIDVAREGILISKMLVQAITSSQAEDLFGRLEPGQLLVQENLATTLEHIANISETDLYSNLIDVNETRLTESLERSKFNEYNLYVPQNDSVGIILIDALKGLEQFNFTKDDTTRPEFIYHIAQTVQNLYEGFKISHFYHEGTISNVAVIDTNENYVSLVTGMYQYFGSREMTSAGYIEDIKNKETVCTRIPILITDSHLICGKRIVFGVNNVATALQIGTSLLIAKENVTESIEASRFHILGNGTIGIEGSHLPLFGDEVLKYLETLTLKPHLVAEPYDSSNIVEKVKDDLSSHADSRGGGIASRF